MAPEEEERWRSEHIFIYNISIFGQLYGNAMGWVVDIY